MLSVNEDPRLTFYRAKCQSQQPGKREEAESDVRFRCFLIYTCKDVRAWIRNYSAPFRIAQVDVSPAGWQGLSQAGSVISQR